jgi:hypothetical protein
VSAASGVTHHSTHWSPGCSCIVSPPLVASWVLLWRLSFCCRNLDCLRVILCVRMNLLLVQHVGMGGDVYDFQVDLIKLVVQDNSMSWLMLPRSSTLSMIMSRLAAPVADYELFAFVRQFVHQRKCLLEGELHFPRCSCRFPPQSRDSINATKTTYLQDFSGKSSPQSINRSLSETKASWLWARRRACANAFNPRAAVSSAF